MKKSIVVPNCIHCGQSHSFIISVEKEIPLFGGPSSDLKFNKTDSEWTFTCPTTNKVFSQKMDLENGLKMKGVVENSSVKYKKTKSSGEGVTKSEFQTWINDSRNRGLSYSTTMLTTSTGAIGVYFAIEKYLGSEKLSNSPSYFVGLLPPVLYLIASLFFVLALKPKFGTVAPSDFESFRLIRLQKINFCNTIGLFSFLAGNVAAVIHFILD